MLGALTFLLIGCLLQGLCGEWALTVPQKIEVMSGSCVTIPCSFDIDSRFEKYLHDSCVAIWKNPSEYIFDNSNPQLTTTKEMTGNLRRKDCTTTFSNMHPGYSNEYHFRLDCQNDLRWTFKHVSVNISVKADPPSPTLSPSSLEVKEGTSVNLACSAPVPCWSLPPTLTWTSGLGDSRETLKSNHNKAKVKTSVLTFTASHLHNGRKVSCTAVYSKQSGSRKSATSKSLTLSISYSPKRTTVSVSPSGPVPENRDVTLTCSSEANPAVRSYTWYRADGVQETFIRTGSVLNIKTSKANNTFFCKAENELGVERSNNTQINVQFPPQILLSSACIKTASQVSCSCETVGKPSPTVHWYLDGQPVSQSGMFAIRAEPLSDKGLRSLITVDQPLQRDLSSLLCHSFNSLGSASQQFCVNSLQSAEHTDRVLLLVFITTVVVLLLLVCVLLFVVRVQRNRRYPKSQFCSETNQPVPRGQLPEEVPKTRAGDIYANSDEVRQAGAALPATVSEPKGTNLPSSRPNNAGSDTIYSSVTWKNKSRKKKGEESVNVNPSGGSYLEEERFTVGGISRAFVSNAMEMESLYNKVERRNMRQETGCEYAQVKFKDRNAKGK